MWPYVRETMPRRETRSTWAMPCGSPQTSSSMRSHHQLCMQSDPDAQGLSRTDFEASGLRSYGRSSMLHCEFSGSIERIFLSNAMSSIPGVYSSVRWHVWQMPHRSLARSLSREMWTLADLFARKSTVDPSVDLSTLIPCVVRYAQHLVRVIVHRARASAKHAAFIRSARRNVANRACHASR